MKMNKLYNENVKNMYLAQYDNEGTILTTKYLFFNSQLMEETLEKDLYDFTTDEIGKLITDINVKNHELALNKRREISNYISWAIGNNHRKDNIHPLKGVSDDWSDQFVDETINQFISKSQLDTMVGTLVNYQDKVVPVLIFNGIYGHKCSELRNLKVSDIQEDGITVRLYDEVKGERLLKLDELVIDLIKKANSEYEYFAKNGLSNSLNPSSELNDTEYVLKATKRGRVSEDNRISQLTLINRINMLSEMFDIPELTPKSIQRSGMIYMVHELSKDNASIQDDKDKFNAVGDKFNWTKINSNGYEYYNVSYVKKFINEENIRKLYK